MNSRKHLFLVILGFCIAVQSLLAIQMEVPFLMHQDSTGSSWKQNVSLVQTSTGETRIFWEDYRNGYSDIWGRLFYNDATIADNYMIINDDEGGANQCNPDVAINNSDYCVVVWEDEREGNKDIYSQKIGADLFILGENFKINSTNDNSIQQNPAISLNDSGEFVIVWEDNRNGKWDIYGQCFDFWGFPSGDNFRISTLSNGSDAITPTVYYHSNGSYVVAWCDDRNGNSDLFMRWYQEDGSILTVDTLINDDVNSADQSYPALYVGPADTGYVVWVDKRNGNSDIFMQKFTMDGQLIGANQFIVEDEDGDEQYHPSIHMSDNQVVVVWDDYRHGHQDIYSQVFDLSGNTIGNNFKINSDTTYNEQSWPDVYLNDDGNMIYSWIDYRAGFPAIYVQNYNIDTGANGENVLINQDIYSSNQENPKISMNHDGTSCTVWQDERDLYTDIFVQFRDNNGDPIGSNIKVNTNSGSRYQATPNCAINNTGASVVVWRYDDRQGYMEIRGQRYNSNQQTMGDNFQINVGEGTISDNRPVVVMNNNGNFSVAWRDRQNEGYGIYIRQYDSEGNALFAPTLVNDNAVAADGKNPSIAMDSLGNTIVIWEDNREGDYNIYCQWIDTTGAFVNPNQLVSIDSLNAYQGSPKISINDKGKGVVVWRDNRMGYPRIFAQYLYIDSGFVGENFLVQEVAEPICQYIPDVSVDTYGNFIVVWQELHGELYILKSLRFDYQHQKEGLTNYVTGLTAASINTFPDVALSKDKILYLWQDANRSKGWDVYGRMVAWEREDPTVEVAKLPMQTKTFETVNNYPNPFNLETAIQYQLDRDAHVTVSIFNIQGKVIRKLFDAEQKRGRYTLNWDGKNGNGLVVSSGVYMVQVKADSRNIHHRMMLIK